MKKIIIATGDMALSAELNDNETARKIWEALPVEGTASTWGKEIYFDIPVTVEQAPEARADVAVGELGYWPTGRAFCLFFGPTPASVDERPRAISPVNLFGTIVGDATVLSSVRDGQAIKVTKG